MNKKSQAVHFLVELLVVVGFGALMMFAASYLVSHEGKYRALDAENIAIFLERVPSIEGNFQYSLYLHGNRSVRITKDTVAIGQENSKEQKYVSKYENPKQFQLEGIDPYTKVDVIYFYKIGDSLEISPIPLPEMEAKLKLLPISSDKLTAVKPSVDINFLKTPNSGDTTNYYFHKQVNSKDLVIYFNELSKDIAFNVYNYYSTIPQPLYLNIILRPITSYDYILPEPNQAQTYSIIIFETNGTLYENKLK